MRDVAERLRDIQEAITRIMKYTNQGRHIFDQNELVQTWVIHHLEIIGEAIRSIPQDFKDSHPEISWKMTCGIAAVMLATCCGEYIRILFSIHDRIFAFGKRASLTTQADR